MTRVAIMLAIGGTRTVHHSASFTGDRLLGSLLADLGRTSDGAWP